MKKFVPKLVKLSEESIKTIPSALATELPAGHMAYAIKPEENGAVFISDAPNGINHICTFVKSEDVEFLPKTTAKSPKVNIDVTIKSEARDTTETKTLSVTLPDNLTDEEVMAVVSAAGKNLDKYWTDKLANMDESDGETPEPTLHELLAMYLTEFGPGETVVLKPDMAVTVEM